MQSNVLFANIDINIVFYISKYISIYEDHDYLTTATVIITALIKSVFKKNCSTSLVVGACVGRCINNLCYAYVENARAFGDANACKKLVEALQVFHSDAQLHYVVFLAVGNLAYHDEKNTQIFLSMGLPDMVMSAFKTFDPHPKVKYYALRYACIPLIVEISAFRHHLGIFPCRRSMSLVRVCFILA